MLGYFRRWRERRMARAMARPMTVRELHRELIRISEKAHKYDRGIRDCGLREVATKNGYRVFTSQEHMVDDGLGIKVEVIEGDDLIEVVTKVRKIADAKADPKIDTRLKRQRDGLYSISPDDGSAERQTNDLIAEFDKIRSA